MQINRSLGPKVRQFELVTCYGRAFSPADWARKTAGALPNAVKHFGRGNVAGFVRNRCLSATSPSHPVSHETSYLTEFR